MIYERFFRRKPLQNDISANLFASLNSIGLSAGLRTSTQKTHSFSRSPGFAHLSKRIVANIATGMANTTANTGENGFAFTNRVAHGRPQTVYLLDDQSEKLPQATIFPKTTAPVQEVSFTQPFCFY